MKITNAVMCTFVGSILHSTASQAAVCDVYAGVGETALEGDSICVVYDPAEIDTLYGTLNIAGDSIFVLPTDFRAESTDGTTLLNADGDGSTSGTTDIAEATGTVQIIAKPGFVLDAIDVGEIGDYKMSTGGSSVDVDGWLRVFDWFDAVPIFGTEETTNLSVSDLTTQGSADPVDWTASGGFDLTTELWDDRDHVGLTLQNTLTAVSSATGEFAWIQKKAVGSEIIVSIETSEIPVPAAVWLFGSGLLGLAGVARRRK